MRLLRIVRQKVLRVLPGCCKGCARRHFWLWFVMCIGVLLCASVALVSAQFLSTKLPMHLAFDPVYELVMRHPSGNHWLDCTVKRRRELIRKYRTWPFSLTMPPYRVEYPEHCIKRSLYMFEFLRIFGVNPVTDDLERPHVFVLGAHTALGKAVIRQLKARNESFMFVNSFDFLDFSNKELLYVLEYIEISKCIVCTTTRGMRHAKNLGRSVADSGDTDFFPPFVEWARSRGIRIVFAKTPLHGKGFEILEKENAVGIEMPYFVDKKTRNDPLNVLYHAITECRKSKTATIDAGRAQLLTSLTGDEIARAILDETPLPSPKESIKMDEMAEYLGKQLECEIKFRDETQSGPVTLDHVPDFVVAAANSRDKMRELYLSIVVVGRHDGFAKGFEKRAQIFLDALANQTQKVPLASYEIVFVDYATPSEATSLSEVFTVHPSIRDKIKFVNVPAKSHVQLCRKLNTSISFLEYIAKNIGIRRAKGRYILTTNPDILFSTDFFDQIEAEEFNDGVLYRASRWSAKPGTEKEYSPDQITEAMNDLETLDSLNIKPACPNEVTGTTWEVSASTIVNDAWPCGAGDFLLLSRDMWFAVQGFNEYPGNAHVDAVFLGKLMKFVPGYIRHTLRTPIVHQSHPEQNSFRPSIRNYEEIIEMYGCDAEYTLYDDANWGLADDQFHEEVFQ